MANPNIVDVTSIYGNTSLTSLTTANVTSIINNPADSGKIFKINTIIVSNVDGSSAAEISISIYSQDDLEGNAFPIASTISVPADSTLIVTDKSTSFYLKENQSVGATAGTADDLVVMASWDEIN